MLKGTVVSFVIGHDVHDPREVFDQGEMIDEKTLAAIIAGARRLIGKYPSRCIEAIKVSPNGHGKPMGYLVKLVLRHVWRPEKFDHEFTFAPHHQSYGDYAEGPAAITRMFVLRATEQIKNRLEEERDQATRRTKEWEKALTPK